jgi:hypothetical protein
MRVYVFFRKLSGNPLRATRLQERARAFVVLYGQISSCLLGQGAALVSCDAHIRSTMEYMDAWAVGRRLAWLAVPFRSTIQEVAWIRTFQAEWRAGATRRPSAPGNISPTGTRHIPRPRTPPCTRPSHALLLHVHRPSTKVGP